VPSKCESSITKEPITPDDKLVYVYSRRLADAGLENNVAINIKVKRFFFIVKSLKSYELSINPISNNCAIIAISHTNGVRPCFKVIGPLIYDS